MMLEDSTMHSIAKWMKGSVDGASALLVTFSDRLRRCLPVGNSTIKQAGRDPQGSCEGEQMH